MKPQRRSPIQVTVEMIVAAAGLEKEFAEAYQKGDEFHLRCKVAESGIMPFVIEVPDVETVSLAHYYTMNGDLVPDPEIVLKRWKAVEYYQPPFLNQHTREGYYLIGATKFANDPWAINLRHQKFADPTVATYTSVSHQAIIDAHKAAQMPQLKKAA